MVTNSDFLHLSIVETDWLQSINNLSTSNGHIATLGFAIFFSYPFGSLLGPPLCSQINKASVLLFVMNAYLSLAYFLT